MHSSLSFQSATAIFRRHNFDTPRSRLYWKTGHAYTRGISVCFESNLPGRIDLLYKCRRIAWLHTLPNSIDQDHICGVRPLPLHATHMHKHTSTKYSSDHSAHNEATIQAHSQQRLCLLGTYLQQQSSPSRLRPPVSPQPAAAALCKPSSWFGTHFYALNNFAGRLEKISRLESQAQCKKLSDL